MTVPLSMRWCSLDLHDKDFPMQTLPAQFVLLALSGRYEIYLLGYAALMAFDGVFSVLNMSSKAVFRYSTLLPSATSAPASTGLTQEAL